MKKYIAIPVISAILILTIYFINRSYSAYKNYQTVLYAEVYMEHIKNLNHLLLEIENESSISALYLSSNGNLDFKQLKDIQKRVDKKIENIFSFIEKNSIFTNYKDILNKLSKDLQYTRSRVDIITPDYINILFDYYHKEISLPLLNEINRVAKKISLELSDTKEYLSLYSDFIKFRSNINREKDLILYILKSSKKMSVDDINLWEMLLRETITPKYNKNIDKRVLSQIKIALENKELSNRLFKLEVEVAKGFYNGQYSIDTTEWNQAIDSRVEQIKEVEKTLYTYLLESMQNSIATPKNLIINISALFFLIPLLITLLLSTNRKESKKKRVKRGKSTSISESIDIRKVYQEEDIFQTDISLNRSNSKKEIETNKDLQFNPLEEFRYTLKSFVDSANKKDIEYRYYIDPTIPTTCKESTKKIKEILQRLINYSLEVTSSNGKVEITIENIAQMKLKNVIKFIIKDSNSYISPEQKRKILKIFSRKGGGKKSVGLKSELLQISELIYDIGGVFEIVSRDKSGTAFIFSLTINK